MPVLDPSLMLSLLTYEDKLEYKSKSFFIKMIKAASNNPKKNLETIEASIQLKNDLMYGLQYFNDLFESSLDQEDIQAKDVYQILYERINIKYKAEQARFGYAGSYFLYGPNLRFYRPCTENDQRSWYLTSTKVAVICIKSLKNDNDYENSLKLYCIEIDLMISNGFSVVIVINYDILENSTNSNLIKIFKTHHFLEIHLILDIPNNYVDKDKNVEHLLKTIRKEYNNLESYFYLYSPFLHNLTPETVNELKKLKQKPFFQNFSFSKPVKKSIDDRIKLMRSNHFVFCKSGFDTDLIFVQLPNVPLYSTDDEDDEFTPCRVSGFSTVYLKVNDYMNWKKTRVPVYCDDEENSNDFIIQYVDFDDLHLIKIGSFVAETLYLTKTASETLDSVISIQNKLFKKMAKNAEFKKESFFLTFQDKKVLKFLTYVSYAYSLHEIKKNPNFSMHKNQIFTALEACRIFTRDNKNDKDKGVIYQVETGEGKSCIICLIASILALLKKTVHIASSNITLANRDYHESFEFFQQIGLKSAVLLHENELPVNLYSDKEKENAQQNQQNQQNQNQNQAQQNSNQNQQNSSGIQNQQSKDKIPIEVKKVDDNQNQNKADNQAQNNENNENKKEEENNENDEENKDKNNDTFVYNKDFYPREFYRKSLFQNSSNMNFSVCGLANENETCKNKANIVFSTFVNFESLYLRLMEASPGYCNEFFKDSSLVIDEADSILIDELTNGTILSRSMKTNGSEVLKYVYKRYQIDENKNAQEIFNEVKQKYPKCKDLRIEDIKDMFSQIDLVNKPEFQDGKKYSIETVEVKEKYSLKKIIEASKQVYGDIKDKVKDKVKDGVKFVGKKLRKSSSSNKNDHKDDNEDVVDDDDDNDDDDEVEVEEVYDIQEPSSKKKRKSDKKKPKDDDKEHKKRKKKDKKKKKEDQIFKKSFHRKVETHKHIVPFDYDHKGVLEPNKEFSGFVQQFIAIKEIFNNKKNHNMIIKDVSMNYLYVSHPIFVHLYSGVCGLTGTIGNFYDKKIFKEQYSLTTKKIPRNRPNLRIEYPVILCDDINERNHKILYEVIEFNKKEYPVLVIFQDLNEISALFNLLSSNGIKNINIFDGKDEKIKPDRIAGLKGAVSLGTNVCGRGTDIKNPAKPLHVIITYFTSNARVMNQAFGRTARQGQEGSVRIICLKNEFISPIGIINKDEMEGVLADYRFKTMLQQKFINKFKIKRPWIFNGGIENQKISDENVLLMRKTNININRLTCVNYEFPICMSIQTFLLIQAQKIFSLYNCPNCKYTWILFQKYVREMILESWSIFIEKAEKDYYQEKIKINYEDYIQSKYDLLIDWILFYLPERNIPESDLQIVPTFIHIFKIVKNIYEPKILSIFPPELRKWLPKDKKEKKIEKKEKEKEKKEKKEKKDKKSKNKIEVVNEINDDNDDDDFQTEKNTFISFLFAFKPYSLIDESGAKINTLNGEDQDRAFIQDPELIYIRKQPHSHFSILSITERIDDLFNMICRKINDVIGSKIGLKFFLRRTLGGCEFGVCYDFDIETNDKLIKNDLNCLVDKDPLLMFTITVKSLIPILAGILIIGLVYIASISKSISQWIMTFPAQFTKELVKKTVKTVAKLIVQDQIDKFCLTVETFLQHILVKQIVKLKEFSDEKAKFFTFLLKLTAPMDFSTVGDKIGEMLGEKISFSSSFASESIGDDLPIAHFLKIGFLLLLCFASFMMNFKANKQSVKFNTKKEAGDFDKNQNVEEAEKQNEDQVDKYDDIEDHNVKFKAEEEKK